MADEKPQNDKAEAADLSAAPVVDLDQKLSAAAEPASEGHTEPSYTPDQIANWQRLEKEHGQLSKFTAVLQERGIATTEDLSANLDLVEKINANPQLKQAVAALLAPDPAVSDSDKAASGMTEDGVKTLMRQMLTEQQAEQAKVQLTAEQATEVGLLDQILASDVVKELTGGLTSKAIWGGEGPKLARAILALADDLLFQQGVNDPVTGLSRPVTDPAAVTKVSTQLNALLGEFKLATLMELSEQPKGFEGPETVQGDGPVQSQLDTKFEGPIADAAAGERNDAMIAQTFKKSFEKTLAGSTGAPLSRGI